MKTIGIWIFVLLGFLIYGCSDSSKKDYYPTVPPAVTEIFAVDNPVIIFFIGVPNADGYRLYDSSDGVTWTLNPASTVLLENNPNFYPNIVGAFDTGNSTTDTYYMVKAFNALGESADSPIVNAAVGSDFTTDVFTITYPTSGTSNVAQAPDLTWNSPGSVLAYFVHIEQGSTESWDYIVMDNSHSFNTTTDVILGKYAPELPTGQSFTLEVSAINFNRWANRRSDTVSFTTIP